MASKILSLKSFSHVRYMGVSVLGDLESVLGLEGEDRSWNVSALLSGVAEKSSGKTAMVVADGRSIHFSQMEFETRRVVELFRGQGIVRGMRVATFVRPGLSFVPTIFALFRIGAVPVFIDPGMTVSNMLACVRESECEAMVGVPLAHLLRKIKRAFFSNIKIFICLTRFEWVGWLFGSAVQNVVVPDEEASFKELSYFCQDMGRDDLAAILFTSGSTGVPKGVEVTHGILWGQQEILHSTFNIGEYEVDMVPFPLFALFSAVWGVTSVIPDMNPAKPAKCSGKKLCEMMVTHGVTHTAGSPSIWRNVLNYAESNDIRFPKLRRILMAGAPVSEDLVRGWQKHFSSDGHVYTPYGATEALPVTVIRDDELIGDCYEKTALGMGTCVGREVGDVQVKVVELSDEAIEQLEEVKELAPFQVGEFIVQGALVTKKYFNRAEATNKAKINDWDKSGPGFWHRMGDVGYRDDKGRLWFCGRRDHRVSLDKTHELYPVQLEPIFNLTPGVQRTALVGVSRGAKGITDLAEEFPEKLPVLMVEKSHSSERLSEKEIRADLLLRAKNDQQTESIEHVLFVKEFPTDVRHNIKINRPMLAKMAEREIPQCER